MTANTQPIFIREPFVTVATLTNEVIARGGTTNRQRDNQLLLQAPSEGALIESIRAIPIIETGAITATVLRIFVELNGTDRLLLVLPEVNLPEITGATPGIPLNSVSVPLNPVLIGDVGRTGLRLGGGDSLWVGLGTLLTVGGYNIVCNGGVY